MKKTFRFALMAAMVCSLGLAATSCKDDENENENNGGQPTAEELASENANTFWAVAADLVSPLEMPDDYVNMTFEPTIGVAQEGSSTVRVVTLPDAEAAAKHFSAIVGADLDETTTTYTYQNDAVGTLTYTKSTDGKSLAKVDVSIKQIPHLQQIVYKTAEQMGTNDAIPGVLYYSLGDVITLPSEEQGYYEYWICIQSQGIEKGMEPVWASVSRLHLKNVWTYTASNQFRYALPTKLGENKEYMMNLAELIYAITLPSKWQENMDNGPQDMKAFNLIPKGNEYINKAYWNLVEKGWNNKLSVDGVFGLRMEGVRNLLTEGNLHFLYRGYSWIKTWSNNLSLYEATITLGKGKEANARHIELKEVKKDVIKNNIKLDCINQLTNHVFWCSDAFFGDDAPRFIFRFATSSQLAGKSSVSHYETLNNYNSDILDAYVYTQFNGIKVGPNEKVVVPKE